jgi:hypothetical protein
MLTGAGYGTAHRAGKALVMRGTHGYFSSCTASLCGLQVRVSPPCVAATAAWLKRLDAMITGFSIPSAFLALESAGRFDYWGAPLSTLTKEQQQARMRTHMTQVLWWRPIEWDRTSTGIMDSDPWITSPDGWLRPGMVPFAAHGSGDQYCWYPSWQTGADMPVVFVHHDELYSKFFARDFGECLCRCFLQNFSDEDPGGSYFAPDVLWDAHFEIILPFLTPEQIDLLRNVRGHLSATACEEADAQIAAGIPDRSLIGIQLSTHYDRNVLDRATLLRLYDRSLSFYRELVEAEGRVEFTQKLEEAKAAQAELLQDG